MICLTRVNHSATLRSRLWRKWDSRVLAQTKLDMDLNFLETSRCPDGPSSCLTSDNRETNANGEQSSILTSLICRRAAEISPFGCVMMWHGETSGDVQMEWRGSRSSVTRSFFRLSGLNEERHNMRTIEYCPALFHLPPLVLWKETIPNCPFSPAARPISKYVPELRTQTWEDEEAQVAWTRRVTARGEMRVLRALAPVQLDRLLAQIWDNHWVMQLCSMNKMTAVILILCPL